MDKKQAICLLIFIILINAYYATIGATERIGILLGLGVSALGFIYTGK